MQNTLNSDSKLLKSDPGHNSAVEKWPGGHYSTLENDRGSFSNGVNFQRYTAFKWAKSMSSSSPHIPVLAPSRIHKDIAPIKRETHLTSNSHILIDDVLSINNPDFENNLGQMYTTEFAI